MKLTVKQLRSVIKEVHETSLEEAGMKDDRSLADRVANPDPEVRGEDPVAKRMRQQLTEMSNQVSHFNGACMKKMRSYAAAEGADYQAMGKEWEKAQEALQVAEIALDKARNVLFSLG